MATTSRHADRQRAVALLYESDLRGDAPGDVLARAEQAGDPPPAFAAELVRGVTDARDEVDALIGRYARGWTIERMPVVDRNLLRVGVWELIGSDVPVAVVIDEAVELANELSTPDSGRFVNGVLAAVARGEDRVAAARDGGADGASG